MDSKQSTQSEGAQQQFSDVCFLDTSGLSTEERQNLCKILQVPVPEEERFPVTDHGNECAEHCPNGPAENSSPVQFGADVLFPMEGPLGGGAEGIAQPPRVAGTDCPVRKEDSPCPREAPQLDVPGVHANNGYHAGALSGRHTGFYPGNAAVAPPPAPFYPAANNAGGVPFTASPIMPEGLPQDISFYQSHPPPNMIQAQHVNTSAGTFLQGSGFSARMPLAAPHQAHQVLVGTYPYGQLGPNNAAAAVDGVPRHVMEAKMHVGQPVPAFLPQSNMAANPTVAAVGPSLGAHQGSSSQQLAPLSGTNRLGKQPTSELSAAAEGKLMANQIPTGKGTLGVDARSSAEVPLVSGAPNIKSSSEVPHVSGAANMKNSSKVPHASGAANIKNSSEVPHASGAANIKNSSKVPCVSGAANIKNSSEVPLVSGAANTKNSSEVPCVSGSANLKKSPEVPRAADNRNSTEVQRVSGGADVKSSTEALQVSKVPQMPGAKDPQQAVSSVSISIDQKNGPSLDGCCQAAQTSAEIKPVPPGPPEVPSKNAPQGAGAQNHSNNLSDTKVPEGPAANSHVDECHSKSGVISPSVAKVCEPIRTNAADSQVESAPTPPTTSAASVIPVGSPALSDEGASQSVAAGLTNGSTVPGLNPSATVFLPRTSAETSTPAASIPPPKQGNWAGLFKGTNASSKPAVVVYTGSNDSKAQVEKTPSAPAAPATSPAKAAVSAKDDPMSAKLGEFFTSWILKDRGVPLMPRGMTNYTNSCFNNATLQALLSVPQIYHLFKDMGDSMGGCPRKVSSTPLCDAMVRLVNEFRPIGKSNCRRGKQTELRIGPQLDSKYILDELAKLNNVLGSGHQQDAQEYLITLLNKLIEEMQNIMRHSTGQKVISNGFSEKDISTPADDADDDAEGQWQEVGPKNRVTHVTRERSWIKTPLDSIVCGLTQSQFMREGSPGSTTVEPFSSLQLVTVHDCITSVDEALQYHARNEIVEDSKDPVTGAKAELLRRTLLEELPPVLILHLKNFQYDQQTGKSTKIIKRIKFEVDLQLPKELLSGHARNNTSASHRNYKLCAVVFHHGKNATGGHYTAVTYEQATNSWSLKDDTSVTSIEESTFLNYSIENNKNIMPYFLIYRQRHNFSHNGTDAY